MGNVFKKQATHNVFSWAGLGNIKTGRRSLGEEMPVFAYRLLEYTMLDVLCQEFGSEKANELFRKSGYLAGAAIAEHALDCSKEMNEFVAALQKYLKEQKIGILRIENLNEATLNFTLTIGEDLDCSGLEATGEVVCHYDEGFLEGIMETYTGKKFRVREIDCWANGDRVCRFQGSQVITEGAEE